MIEDVAGWICRDLEEGLEGSQARAEDSETVTRCRASVAVQYILHAGHAMLEAAKDPSKTWVDQARWNVWAAKLKDLAESTPEGAEWDLKTHSGRAHERMVELWPEVFEEEGGKQ